MSSPIVKPHIVRTRLTIVVTIQSSSSRRNCCKTSPLPPRHGVWDPSVNSRLKPSTILLPWTWIARIIFDWPQNRNLIFVQPVLSKRHGEYFLSVGRVQRMEILSQESRYGETRTWRAEWNAPTRSLEHETCSLQISGWLSHSIVAVTTVNVIHEWCIFDFHQFANRRFLWWKHHQQSHSVGGLHKNRSKRVEYKWSIELITTITVILCCMYLQREKVNRCKGIINILWYSKNQVVWTVGCGDITTWIRDNLKMAW